MASNRTSAWVAKFSTFACALLIAHLRLPPATAHEVNTHAYIGHEAVFLVDSWLPPLPNVFGQDVRSAGAFIDSDYGTQDGNPDSGTRLLEGMMEEDAGLQARRHFWFPGNDYKAGLVHFDSALEEGQRQWRLAIEDYRCNGNKSLAYWRLGRVAHLLQDMSSPAHVHIDQHLPRLGEQNWDSFERWVGENGPSGTPNFFGIPSKLPAMPGPYVGKVPGSFDLAVCSLFSSLGTIGRKYDSDDSGYFAPQSTEQKGKYNSFRAYVVPGSDFAGSQPQVTWYRQTEDGVLTTAQEVRVLQLDSGFEYDDYLGSGEDRIYLYPAVAEVFDEDWYWDGKYDVLVVRVAGAEKPFSRIEDAWLLSRQHLVPTSVIKRIHMPELIGQSIGHTAMLLVDFWSKAFAGESCDFEVSAKGSSSLLADPIAGGDGGKVSFNVGFCSELPLGNGADGSVYSSMRLDKSEYNFVQVVAGDGDDLELEITGDVVIRCQYAFAPTRVYASPDVSPAPRVTVFAGSALQVVLGADGVPISWEPESHGAVVELDGPEGETCTGGSFSFSTTQLGDFTADIDVSGGWGWLGQKAGDGGEATVIVCGGRFDGRIEAGGGSVIGATQGGSTADGGAGGTIRVRARSLEGEFYADGGDGGHGTTPVAPTKPGSDGPPGEPGGAGGKGGTIAVAAVQQAADHIEASACGGDGGWGGCGVDGLSGSSSSATALKGGNGGQGGAAGNGGPQGRATGFNPGSKIHLNGGNGGRGGCGGDGGTGGTYAQQNGSGGNGGDGGSGGNAGGSGGDPGEGGTPGAGGGAATTQLKGSPGKPGLPGHSGGGSGAIAGEPPPACECGEMRGTSLGLLRASFIPSQGTQLRFTAVPGFSSYTVEASPDMASWSVITNITTSKSAFEVLDALPPGEKQRFYRVRMQ